MSDTGCRLGEDAKALLRAARDKAAHGRAAEAQADIANHMDFGRFGQGVVKLLGKRLMNEPDDASDYIATIEADLGHDATDALSKDRRDHLGDRRQPGLLLPRRDHS